MSEKIGYTGMLYAPSGGGKTWNSLTLPGNLTMLSTDCSYNLAHKMVNPKAHIIDIVKWVGDDGFMKVFEREVAKQPTTVIIDNLSDLLDLAVLELIDSPNAPADPRQCYNAVYQSLRRFCRKANYVGCNVLLLAWQDVNVIPLPSGKKVEKLDPKLPAKLIDSVTGLCNIVGRISSGDVGGQMAWWVELQGSETLRAKDQVWGRQRCLVKDLFTPPATTAQGGKK